jgi:hypothetical protein
MDAEHGKCQGLEGTSAGGVKCSEPAVATYSNSLGAVVRLCKKHAQLMENTQGPVIDWD